MGVHDGHRDRLRARFLEYGLDNFNDLNALELLLFYAIPSAIPTRSPMRCWNVSVLSKGSFMPPKESCSRYRG